MYNNNKYKKPKYQYKELKKKNYTNYNVDPFNFMSGSVNNNKQKVANEFFNKCHNYDMASYAQMVSSGISKEDALDALEYFYSNLERLHKND